MSSATWHPSTGQYGIFGTAWDSEARERHDEYGTHDRTMWGIIDQSKEVMGDAYTGMQTQMYDYFGGDDPNTPEVENDVGMLDKKYDFKLENVQLQTGNELMQLDAGIDKNISKAGFATNQPAEISRVGAHQKISRGYQANVGLTLQDKKKEESDFVAKMRSDWNSLLMSYHQATGNEYVGDEDMDELFKQYT